MKTVLYISLLFLSLHCLPALAQEQQVVVPYTLADRDRAILTEAKMSTLEARIIALEEKMAVRFESIDKRFMYQQKQISNKNNIMSYIFGNIK